MKVYLAGPMAGHPSFNIPAFDEAACWLRAAGHEVVSPAELDNEQTRAEAMASPDGRNMPNGQTWGDFLARDVKIVADEVDAVALLPGWEASRGARLEVFVALLCGKSLYRYWPCPGATLSPLHRIDAALECVRALLFKEAA